MGVFLLQHSASSASARRPLRTKKLWITHMDIITQNIINGVTTYTLTDYGFALINEFFRTAAFVSATFLFLISFYIFYRITEK